MKTDKGIINMMVLIKEDAVVTLMCFLIYKEWLLLSLENKKRNTNINLSYYKVNCYWEQKYISYVSALIKNIQIN